MEDPETLEAENPDLELLEEASEATDFLTLIGGSNGLGSILDVQLQENGNAAGGNSLAMDVKENGVSEEGCLLNGGVDEKQVCQMDIAAAELGDERLEDTVDNGNNGNVVVEPVRDEGGKEDVGSGVYGDDSVRRIEVSGDNISLYVDFSGSLNEVSGSGLTVSEEGLREAANEELIFGGQEYQFYVGDVVWIRTKSQSWWPGKIFDPSDTMEYALEGDHTKCWLVRYFGSSHLAWCHPSRLKPFHVDFEQMTGQNKARSFIGAVEKAIDDFGKRLQLLMTCSCVLKENKSSTNKSAINDKGASVPVCEIGELERFSAAEFEPAKFLCKLKNLAEAVSKPDMLEFIALKSHLLAFCRSVGYCCLPIHQLCGTCDAENASSRLAEENNFSYKLVLEQSDVTKNEISQLNQNGDLAEILGEDLGGLQENCENLIVEDASASSSGKIKRKSCSEVRTSCIPSKEPDQGMCLSSVENANDMAEFKNEKGFDLRERKRSKYLSYPYINFESKELNKTDDHNALKVSQEGLNGSPSAAKSSAKRLQKKWYRKFIRKDDITAYPELMNTSCADLLSEMQFIAVDCLFPTESKNFDLIKWFFYKFRVSVYHDESVYEMYCKDVDSQKEAAATDSCFLGNVPYAVKPTPGNEMKEREKMTDAGSKIKSLPGLSGVDISFARCNLLANEFRAVASDTTTAKQTLAGLQTKQTTNIPDLNGNIDVPISMVEDSHVMCHIASEPRKRKRKRAASKPLKTEMTPSLCVANGNNASSRSFMLDFQIKGPCSTEKIPEQSYMEGLNVGPPDSSGNYAPAKPDTLSFAAESKKGPKKRGRKPKALPGHPTHLLSVGIPDLNGTSTEPNKDLQEANNVSPAVKPVRRRRRRRKGEASLSSPNAIVNYHKAAAKVKPLGTTLLLTFSPGVTMPSKEVLLATFCKFGPLKESEFLIIKESNSAQVVFMRSEDAQQALQSLENSNPFGVSLLNYHLRNDTIRTAQPMDGLRLPAQPSGSIPILGESPPIDFIKQNLEMMTTMLQKSGDNLLPEMKAKLENEIKGLMEKVSSYPS